MISKPWRMAKTFFWIAVLAAIPVLFFGLFIKMTDEYDCALQLVRRDPRVVAVTGEPITPGLFAWSPYYESGGGVQQGAFSTTVSGPQGHGRVRAEFYRSPVGATLYLTLKTGGEEVEIYRGPYPCR